MLTWTKQKNSLDRNFSTDNSETTKIGTAFNIQHLLDVTLHKAYLKIAKDIKED